MEHAMSDEADFKLDFFQDVQGRAGASGQFAEDAFFEAMCEPIVESGDLVTADRAFYTNNRGVRVDGYGGDPAESGGSLTLIVSDFSNEATLSTLTQTELDAAFKRVQNFVDKSRDRKFVDSLEESTAGFGLADLINARWAEISKVRLLLITDKVLSKRIDGLKAGELDGKPVAQNVWDIARLRQFNEGGQRGDPIRIDLEADFGGGMPVLTAHAEEGSYESYLAVIPGSQLAEIYDRWGPRLLEQNVRVFLQARGAVNKGIRNTLEHEPGMFFAFNNGITATAEGVTLANGPNGIEVTAIDNLQIVNGGQSTASVHAATRRGVDLSRVFVQMKLMIVGSDRVSELVPRISEYANTQNKVAAADFFANHPYHVRLEQISRRLYAPTTDGGVRQTKWFYERARGQYQDDRALVSGAKRRKFDAEYPKRQLISKTDLAKFMMVWELQPHTVSLGAQKNFAAFAKLAAAQWERSEASVNEHYFRQMVAKAIIFRHVERLVSDRPWYEGGYRANVVAYTIARLASEIAGLKAELDFDRVWREQSVGDSLNGALTASADAVVQVIIDPPSGARNVTEWAKQVACWTRVERLHIDWPDDLDSVLIAKSVGAKRAEEALAAQKVDNGIEAQTMVVNAGTKAWRDVEAWGRERGLISEKESSILKICASVPKAVPTERQSQAALATLKRLHSEGCQLLKTI